jgi:type II secretory pathway pseudopilin PulG
MRTVQSSTQTAGSNRGAGFTLIEALVAIALGTIMLLALSSSFTFCFTTVRTSLENVRAEQITLARLERIRLCSASQITNTFLNPTNFTEAFDPNSTNGGSVFSGTFSAVVPPAGSLPDSYRTSMFLITVGVTWTSGNIQHSLTNQAYVATSGMASYIGQ